MAANHKYNRAKLKALIHYVAYRCIGDPKVLDSVKLNKVLWYSDLDAYVATGSPLTGEKYIKKHLGPVSSSLMPLLEELESDRSLAVRKLGPDSPAEYLALTTPDVTAFTAAEMLVIENSIDTVVHKNTSKSISEKSHTVVWHLAELDEEIPYYAIHAGRLHDIESSDLDWAKKEVTELG